MFICFSRVSPIQIQLAFLVDLSRSTSFYSVLDRSFLAVQRSRNVSLSDCRQGRRRCCGAAHRRQTPGRPNSAAPNIPARLMKLPDRVPLHSFTFLDSIGLHCRHHRQTELRSRTESPSRFRSLGEPDPDHLWHTYSSYTCITSPQCHSDIPRPGVGSHSARHYHTAVVVSLQKWEQSRKHPQTLRATSHQNQRSGD